VRPLKPSFAAARGRLGLTMVEVVFVAIIVSMLVGAIGLTVRQGSGAYTQGVTSAEVEAGARRMVERIARELVDASSDSIDASDPQSGLTWMTFERCQGFDGGTVLYTPVRRLRLVMQPGELNNNLDDNSNGLVDERRLELLPDDENEPDKTVGWGGYVRECIEGETANGADDNGNGLIDEPGLQLMWDEAQGLVTVRLTLERLDSLGRPLTRTIETAVQVRNE
jgi:hypothetical protein